MQLYKFACGPLETNSFLFACSKTKKAAVIDPSMGSASLVLRKAKAHELTIEKILLTHSHWDHIADLRQLAEQTGADVYVHQLDEKNVEEPGSDGIPLMMPIRGFKPECLLNGDDQIDIGMLRCTVFHTPGHSPGSVCYYLRDQSTLFSGDTLFAGTIGAVHFSTGEPEKMWESLRMISTLPPETRVLPGHGPETTLAKENWLSRAKEIFS